MAQPRPSIDPLQALTTAVSLPADSRGQIDILAQLRLQLEEQPASIALLCTTILPTTVGSKDSAFKRWVLDLLHHGLSKSTLGLEIKTQLASQTLDNLVALLAENAIAPLKTVIQCFCSVYPLLFSFLCVQRNMRGMWETLSQGKARILAMFDSPDTAVGVKLSALKFLQRTILVQSRGVSDPRLQNKADPNLSQCPIDHPFMNAGHLEREGVNLLQQLLTTLYSSHNVEIIAAICNLLVALVKLRQGSIKLVVSALTVWTPAQLTGQPPSVIKSAEKALRIVLVHISRHGYGAAHQKEINEALAHQQARMEVIAREEHARRVADASKKRSLAQGEDDSQVKRAKVNTPEVQVSNDELLSYFSGLPVSLLTDLVIANLQAIPQTRLVAAVESYRQQNPPEPPLIPNNQASTAVKEEDIDPLKLELDDDELEFEPEKLNSNLQVQGDNDIAETDDAEEAAFAALRLVDFELPPPKPLADFERQIAVKDSINRIRRLGEDMFVEPITDNTEGDDVTQVAQLKAVNGLPATEAWMLFLVRMISRGPVWSGDTLLGNQSDDQDSITMTPGERMLSPRQMMCEYIIQDFPSRAKLANIWLNEEWYNDSIRTLEHPGWQSQYEIWLQQLITLRLENLDPKDKAFPQFLVDLPAIPLNVFTLLRELCSDQERMPVGFTTLRELIVLRPPLRPLAMNILLELTTHHDKVTRGAAIITLRRWVPDQQPMDGMIQEYALRLLQRLEISPRPVPLVPSVKNPADEGEGDGETDVSMPHVSVKLEGEPLSSPYLLDDIQPPIDKAIVLQHVELILALSIKVPEFLDEIFAAYGQMDESVQSAIKEHIVQLIKTLGPNNGKLLTVMRTFPHAAESLALRVLMILTDHQKPTPPLVALIKSLVAERDLDARFIIPIIGELEKADIIKHVPKIVSMLNGKAEERDIVRKVFSNVITESPTGGTSTNMPRVKQDQRLNPADLMVLLHEREKEIGLKSAIEAISICFSMTDVFRWEVLAIVMQQIVDEPTLPVLFMRTVIQAVTTYKNLVSFVTTTLFTRLIVKKIWTIPPLWEGFIRCAKVTAPASFGALLSLHKDQLREVVDKQPSLKSGLRDHLLKKAGSKAKASAAWEVLGDEATGGETPAVAVPGV